MIATIPENGLQDKVCQHLSLGLLQDVLPVSQIEELLETYQMWEQRERQLNMVAIVYWLIGLHLYPHLSQRAVYAKLVHKLQAQDIKGRVIILPAANFPAATAGTRLSPVDGENLNRWFPGSADGPPTAQEAGQRLLQERS